MQIPLPRRRKNHSKDSLKGGRKLEKAEKVEREPRDPGKMGGPRRICLVKPQTCRPRHLRCRCHQQNHCPLVKEPKKLGKERMQSLQRLQRLENRMLGMLGLRVLVLVLIRSQERREQTAVLPPAGRLAPHLQELQGRE